MAKMTAANFCKEHPWCCFCGGTTPSANIDHQPARIIFPDKQRPKGLEFPACHICNDQTRADEVLLAFICRFAGSRRPHAPRDSHRVKKILLGVRRGFPGLLESMDGRRRWIQDKGIWSRGGAIKVDDPKIALSLCRIAAKLALAMFYEITKGAAPKGTRIHTMWTHSQREGARYVEDLVRTIPSQAVL